MSNATPPGWYPDAAIPGTERWWDGAAWTAHTRPAVPAPQQFGPPAPQFGQPVPPGEALARTGGASGGRGGPGATRIVAVAVAGLVVVGAAVTGALLLRGGDGTPEAGPASSAPKPTTTATATGTPSSDGSPAEDEPKVLVDQLNGITLPIPAGWEKPERTVDKVLTMRTVDSYQCPGASGRYCYHGTVTSRTASATDSTSAEELAKQDIAAAADAAYGKDLIGNRFHGGITSHEELASESVSVAGRTGYRVRWRVETGKGPGGYVQSLVFPSTVGSETPVIVRYAFDAGPDGPSLPLMDTITKGIRPIGDSATSGGVGSSVGP
ncbi:DUF2510 domain-containing protein [Streptomyces sp. NPDC087218]|uniref:DUF2510 domain-containing protein n=1 Tax=Streptomyces sp. NPDC087218 TaxID=3365769 RepID=UPI003807A4BC